MNIGGVPCAIYHGEDDVGYGISESHSYDGRRALVHLICYWDDRLDLIGRLIGRVYYQGGVIFRDDPAYYPLASRNDITSPGGSIREVFPARLFCTGIASVTGIKSWTDPDGSNTGEASWAGYTFAVVAAEFTCPPYLIQPLWGPGIAPTDPSFNDLIFQNYVISRVDVSGEVFSPPDNAFLWNGGADAGTPLLGIGAMMVRTRFELSAIRVRMPLVPVVTVASLMGTVNAKPIPLAGMVFPAESALFMGMRPEQRSDPYNCGIVWDVEYKWLINGQAVGNPAPLSWNYFMDLHGTWNPIKTATGGNPPFPLADHSVLFLDAIS